METVNELKNLVNFDDFVVITEGEIIEEGLWDDIKKSFKSGELTKDKFKKKLSAWKIKMSDDEFEELMQNAKKYNYSGELKIYKGKAVFVPTSKLKKVGSFSSPEGKYHK